MMKWFKNKKDIKNKELDEKIKSSTSQLVEAANITISLAEEITDALKNSIEDSYKELSATVEIIPDAIFIVRRSGIIESANSQAKNLFGIEELLPETSIFDFISFNSTKIRNTEELEKISTVINEKLTFSSDTDVHNIRGKTTDGKTITLKVKVNYFKKSDKIVRYVVLMENITDRIEQEKRFVTLYNYNNGIISAIPQTLITVDMAGVIKSIHNKGSFIDISFMDKNITDAFDEILVKQFRHFKKNPMVYNNSQIHFTKIIGGIEKNFTSKILECQSEALFVISDISEIVETKRELDQTEDYLRAFEKASSEAMFIHIDDQLIRWNDNMRNLFGYSDEDMENLRPVDFITPLDRAKYLSNISDDENKSYEILMVNKKGDSIEASVTDNVIIWNDKKAHIKVIRDISDLTNVKKMQTVSRERYATIMNNTIDLVFSLSEKFELKFSNVTFDQFVGEGKVHSVIDFIDSRDLARFIGDFSNLKDPSTAIRILTRINRTGIVRHIDIIANRIHDAEGNFVEYQCVGRDVTYYIAKSSKE